MHAKPFSQATFFFTIGICLLVGITGSWFTHQSLHSWYPLLHKPSFTPPNWLFPVAWTLLYILMGTAWALILNKNISLTSKLTCSAAFLVQLFFNFLWSFLFFYLQNPLFGLLDISALWVAIGFTFWIFNSYSRIAALLLLPYWAWVNFAWLLNYRIWMEN